MDSAAGALIDGVLKIVGGFAIGWVVRGALRVQGGAKHKPATVAKKKAATPSKPQAPIPREELKMVLCVNMSLKMGTGKIGAQCAHAAVGVIQHHSSTHSANFKYWERYGQPKIALKVQDDTEMAALEAKAQSLGMPTYIVHDAGRYDTSSCFPWIICELRSFVITSICLTRHIIACMNVTWPCWLKALARLLGAYSVNKRSLAGLLWVLTGRRLLLARKLCLRSGLRLRAR